MNKPASLPLIALVGRPNVGKSTLFNRLVGYEMSIVDNQPGVTRDRIFGTARLDGKAFAFVDTGGFDADSDDPLLDRMREQTQLAIDESDFVLVILDGREGLKPADKDVVQWLRRAGKPFVGVANKLDTPDLDDGANDFYALGIDQVLPLSAAHSRGFEALIDFLCEKVPAPEEEVLETLSQQPIPVDAAEPQEGSRIEWRGGPIRVAVIGRPNVGKSSLVNRLLGEERLLATDIAGTTRDAIDVEIERQGQQYVFVDTAGIRRKRSIVNRLERFSVMAALRSVHGADVALVMLDSTAMISDQDARVASIAHERGLGIVVIANKWDLIENPEWRDGFPKAVQVDLPFLDYAPFIRTSAKTGRNVEKIFASIDDAQRSRHRRIATGELNRFFRDVVERHPPPIHQGKRAKLYYVAQPLVRPPTFMFTASRADHVPQSYARFLRNQLRERFDFTGSPLWLKFKPRGKSKGGGSKLDK
ncbi:MAG: ribosome biogenesis GTPase Der [Myxococcota bacterium]